MAGPPLTVIGRGDDGGSWSPRPLRFAHAVRALAIEARRAGFVVPGFRSPPRLAGVDRSLRRRSGGGATGRRRGPRAPMARGARRHGRRGGRDQPPPGAAADQARARLWAAPSAPTPPRRHDVRRLAFLAPVPQPAEGAPLKGAQCGFEPHRGTHLQCAHRCVRSRQKSGTLPRSRHMATQTGARGRLRAACSSRRRRAVPDDARHVGDERVDRDRGGRRGHDRHGIQTAITLYTLVMASLMITGGKIGEILGRSPPFTIGCVIYGAGSFTTSIAPNLGILIFGWSFLEGVGAVLILPAVVALVATNFAQPIDPAPTGSSRPPARSPSRSGRSSAGCSRRTGRGDGCSPPRSSSCSASSSSPGG